MYAYMCLSMRIYPYVLISANVWLYMLIHAYTGKQAHQLARTTLQHETRFPFQCRPGLGLASSAAHSAPNICQTGSWAGGCAKTDGTIEAAATDPKNDLRVT